MLENMKKPGKKVIGYFTVGLVVFISLTVGYLVVDSNTKSSVSKTNDQVKAFADLSTKSIVDAYELYYASGYSKFVEIVNDTLKISPNVSRFQLVNTDGRLLFDSGKKTDTALTADSGLHDSIRKIETTYVMGKDEKLAKIISPYIEEWGRHPYSVIYYIDYGQTDREISAFRAQIIFFTILISLAAAATLIATISYKNLALKREERDQLEQVNKQKDEFLMIASHNLRTPLTNIKGFLSLFKEKNKEIIETQKDLFQPIEEESEKLGILVETMININEILAGKVTFKFAPTDLFALTEEIGRASCRERV